MPCGGTHFATVTPQNASSPHLSNIRRPLSTCTWIIEAPPYQNIKITVWELQLASQDCSRSYLELRDSPQVKTPACWPSHLQALEAVKPCPNQVPVPSKIVFFFSRRQSPTFHHTKKLKFPVGKRLCKCPTSKKHPAILLKMHIPRAPFKHWFIGITHVNQHLMNMSCVLPPIPELRRLHLENHVCDQQDWCRVNWRDPYKI